MDKDEARAIVRDRLNELRRVPFVELTNRFLDPDQQETSEVTAPSGVRYQVETQALREGEGLRVMVAVDDGGVHAFAPVSDDFIMTPDGGFVGESDSN